MITYKSIRELVEAASEEGKRISDLVLADQSEQMDIPADEIYKTMRENFRVMKESIDEGLKGENRSQSGLTGGDAMKLQKAINAGNNIGGSMLSGVLAKALAVSELNACMGRIVAAPTAGSCGIMPAVLMAVMEEKNIAEEKVIMSMFTASAIGMVIAARASVSGAEGGCQAETGSAAAMAAAAVVELFGGSPEMSSHACAIALKNVLGLVCDPVAGLVEIPCIKRNALGSANALVAAELALAGIESIIPADEVIDAMKSVGDSMSHALKETALGGLAATPTGRRLSERIMG